MARDFVSCERGQMLLMPPSLVEWLPENDLVWTILGVVDQMDLDRFCEDYRLGGAGRPEYDPAMWRCFCTREQVFAGDRAGVLGGRGLQGDLRDAHAGSLDDRGVPPPARRRHQAVVR
jgi:hypothetical protein